MILLFASIAGILAHTCVHDRVQRSIAVETHEQQYDTDAHKRQASVATQPLRVVFDTDDLGNTASDCKQVGTLVVAEGVQFACTNDYILTQVLKNRLRKLLSDVEQYLESMFNIVRSSGPLTIQTPTICRRPISTVKYQASSSDPIRSQVDLVLKVTSWPTEDGTLAWASYCVLDQFGRPIAGHVNVGPNALAASSDHMMFNTLVHEVFHAMGFNGGRMNNFFNADGSTYTPTQRVTLGSGGAQKTAFVVNSPRVKAQARAHFDCDSLEGMELEDFMENGRVGSHWEERVLGSEVMTPVTNEGDVGVQVSAITLAYFEDMGVYFPNYTMALDPGYGRSEGCAFVQQSPNVRQAQYPAYSCKGKAGNICAPDLTGYSLCQWYEYTEDLPAWSRPDPSDARRGGSEYGDFVVEPGTSMYCKGSAPNTGNNHQGASYGAASQCMMSSVVDQKYIVPSATRATCYEQRCVGTPVRAEVKIGAQWVACPANGGELSVDNEQFHGKLACGSVEQMCCTSLDQCSGNGECVRGRCLCRKGFGGADCSTQRPRAVATTSRVGWSRVFNAEEEVTIMEPPHGGGGLGKKLPTEGDAPFVFVTSHAATAAVAPLSFVFALLLAQ